MLVAGYNTQPYMCAKTHPLHVCSIKAGVQKYIISTKLEINPGTHHGYENYYLDNCDAVLTAPVWSWNGIYTLCTVMCYIDVF